MRITAQQLVAVIILGFLCIAWGYNRFKLSKKIESLNNREMVNVIDLYDSKPSFFKYSPSFSLRDSEILSLPEWPNAENEPPVSAATVRKIAEDIVFKMKSSKADENYEQFWLSSIKLAPLVVADEDSAAPKHWCYYVDFSGKRTAASLKGTQLSSAVLNIYRVIVLMDGSVHTSPHHSDVGFRSKMAEFYPAQAPTEIDYVIRGVKQYADNEHKN